MTKSLRLQQARTQKGITQSTAAKDLHIALTTYRGWEQSSEPRTLDTAARLCAYMGISLDYYVTGKEPAPQLTTAQQTLLEITQQLPPALQDAFITALTLVAQHLHSPQNQATDHTTD